MLRSVPIKTESHYQRGQFIGRQSVGRLQQTARNGIFLPRYGATNVNPRANAFARLIVSATSE